MWVWSALTWARTTVLKTWVGGPYMHHGMGPSRARAPPVGGEARGTLGHSQQTATTRVLRSAQGKAPTPPPASCLSGAVAGLTLHVKFHP